MTPDHRIIHLTDTQQQPAMSGLTSCRHLEAGCKTDLLSSWSAPSDQPILFGGLMLKGNSSLGYCTLHSNNGWTGLNTDGQITVKQPHMLHTSCMLALLSVSNRYTQQCKHLVDCPECVGVY